MSDQLRAASDALRLVADIDHWQAEAVGAPGGERNTGSLAPGYSVQALIAGALMDAFEGEVDDLGPGARIADDLAAVDIDRREPPRSELEWLSRTKMRRLDFQ